MRIQSMLIALLALVTFNSVLAQEALNENERTLLTVVEPLQRSVQRDDRAAVAKLLVYPLDVWNGRKRVTVSTPSEFLAIYDRVVDFRLKRTIAHADVRKAFSNSQGFMFDDGRIWIGTRGERFGVITINEPTIHRYGESILFDEDSTMSFPDVIGESLGRDVFLFTAPAAEARISIPQGQKEATFAIGGKSYKAQVVAPPADGRSGHFILHALPTDSSADAMTRRVADAERALAELRRFVPEAAASGELTAFLARDPAFKAKVEPLAPSRTEPSLGVELCRAAVSGRGSFEQIDSFFRRIERQPRVIDVESLDLSPQTDGSIAMNGKIAWLCWDEIGINKGAVTPRGASADELIRLELQQRLDWLERNAAFISSRQASAHANPLRSLGQIGAATSGHAAAITSFQTSGNHFTAAVLAIGVTAAAKLRAIGSGRETTAGDCRSFSFDGPLAAATAPAPAPSLLFDRDAASHCNASNRAATKIAAHAGGGDLTLALDAVQLRDLFRVLHELTGESFLVRDDVDGTVTFDAHDVTSDALLKQMPVDISSGRLHVVRPLKSAALHADKQSYAGEPISIELDDADVNDVFCMFGRITSLKFAVPPTTRRVSAYVKELPWDEVVAALMSSFGWTYRIDGARVVVGEGETRDACTSLPAAKQWWRIEASQLTADDLRIAALGRDSKGEWKAFAYPPGAKQKLVALTRGIRFADGKVSDVKGDGVTFVRGGRTVVRRITSAAR
jgi:hypothetical protein